MVKTSSSARLLEISEEQLENFKAHRRTGEFIVRYLEKMFKEHSKRTISRVKIVGSTGKQSSTVSSYQSDFDMVVFVTNDFPPFTSVFNNLETILNCYSNIDDKIKISLVRRRNNFIDFRVKNNSGNKPSISIDLSVAMNFLSPEHEIKPYPSRKKMVEIQTERAYRFISTVPAKQRFKRCYGDSLLELGIIFVEKQSCFVHHVTRLAKLWNRKVPWEGIHEKLVKRSSIIELVAIWAAVTEEKEAKLQGKEASISKAFQLFLKSFIDFNRNMRVYFPFQRSTNILIFYEQHSKQVSSAKNTFLIMDTLNPYRNWAMSFTSAMKSSFEEHAKITLKAIKDYTGKEKSVAVLNECFDI